MWVLKKLEVMTQFYANTRRVLQNRLMPNPDIEDASCRQVVRRLVLAICIALSSPSVPAFAQSKSIPATATILVLGDSLSAEYGLKRGTGWVPLLEQRLQKRKIKATVFNASISGETTSGGKSRLPDLLRKHSPAYVLLELGANDALRGLPLTSTEANLRFIVQESKKIGAKVLIIGIQIPPNYGKTYTDQFAAIFSDLAKSEKTGLVPFLLEGFADKPSAFQADRIHPNESAQAAMMETVWKEFAGLVR